MNGLQFGETIYLSEADLFSYEISKESGLSPRCPDSVFHIQPESKGYLVTRFPVDLPPNNEEIIWPEKRVETLKLNKFGESQRIDILGRRFFKEFIGTLPDTHILGYLIRDITESPPSSL